MEYTRIDIPFGSIFFQILGFVFLIALIYSGFLAIKALRKYVRT
ncbi:hypothetical protein NSQ54_08825 [Alkalihalobacillus sp. FSL W8-0930]